VARLAGDFAKPITSLARLIPVPANNRSRRPIALWIRHDRPRKSWSGRAVRSIAEAGKQIGLLENQVKQSQDSRSANALWELDQVRERINHALADAAAIKIVSNSDRSELVRGEGFNVRAEVAHRADAPAIFSKPNLTLPSDGGITSRREGRHDQFQRRGSRRSADAAHAGRLDVSVPRRRWSAPSRMLKWTDTRLISARPS